MQNNLFKLRTQGKRYITQRELSERSGYTQPYISLIETGKVKPSVRCKKALLEVLKNELGPYNSY